MGGGVGAQVGDRCRIVQVLIPDGGVPRALGVRLRVEVVAVSVAEVGQVLGAGRPLAVFLDQRHSCGGEFASLGLACAGRLAVGALPGDLVGEIADGVGGDQPVDGFRVIVELGEGGQHVHGELVVVGLDQGRSCPLADLPRCRDGMANFLLGAVGALGEDGARHACLFRVEQRGGLLQRCECETALVGVLDERVDVVLARLAQGGVHDVDGDFGVIELLGRAEPTVSLEDLVQVVLAAQGHDGERNPDAVGLDGVDQPVIEPDVFPGAVGHQLVDGEGGPGDCGGCRGAHDRSLRLMGWMGRSGKGCRPNPLST